jgi:hypothetical protein
LFGSVKLAEGDINISVFTLARAQGVDLKPLHFGHSLLLLAEFVFANYTLRVSCCLLHETNMKGKRSEPLD